MKFKGNRKFKKVKVTVKGYTSPARKVPSHERVTYVKKADAKTTAKKTMSKKGRAGRGNVVKRV